VRREEGATKGDEGKREEENEEEGPMSDVPLVSSPSDKEGDDGAIPRVTSFGKDPDIN
jgi:hypothetical protein